MSTFKAVIEGKNQKPSFAILESEGQSTGVDVAILVFGLVTLMKKLAQRHAEANDCDCGIEKKIYKIIDAIDSVVDSEKD